MHLLFLFAPLSFNLEYQENLIIGCRDIQIGPSGVRALPVAAGTNEGGHYFWYFSFSFLLQTLFKTIEGIVVGFYIFAWAPK